MLINYQGTLPFASLQVLQWAEDGGKGFGAAHTVTDDLESFFYVFMWLCVLYDGPGVLRPSPEDDCFIAHAWGEGGMGPGGITLVLNAKIRFIHSPGNSIIDTQFTPYFKNLKPLAKEWKQLVKMEDERVSAKRSGMSTYTHNDVIALLHKYADNLADFDSLPCPVPSTQSPPLEPANLSIKRPPPSPLKQFSKRRRCNSLESVGTVWAPKKTG